MHVNSNGNEVRTKHEMKSLNERIIFKKNRFSRLLRLSFRLKSILHDYVLKLNLYRTFHDSLQNEPTHHVNHETHG